MGAILLRPTRVCFPFVGDIVGGAQVSATLLHQGLASLGSEPRFVLHEKGLFSDYLDGLGVETTLVPLPTYVGSSKGAASHAIDLSRVIVPLTRYLRSHRFDILHAHDGRMNLTWGVPARAAGVPFIWHQRSPFVPQKLMRVLVRTATEVICISNFVRSTLPAPLQERADVVYNPFQTSGPSPDRDAARQRLLEEFNAGPDARIVGFVGNLAPQKRATVFIEAAAHLLSRTSQPLVFPIFGADIEHHSAELEQLIKQLAIRNHVRLVGFRAPIAPALAGFDVLVAPAVREGFGRTIVEAMLCGTPVVVSNSGGHPEIVEPGRTGLLFEPDEPSAISDHVFNLLDRPELGSKLADAAQKTARARFSIQTHASTMQDLYSSLRERARGRK